MVKVDNVSVEFKTRGGRVEALSGVNIEIGSEFVAILGPSGSGKTTLLRVISGLLAPSSGRVTYVENSPPNFAIVFQEYSLLPWLPIWKNVSLSLEMKGVPEPEQKLVAGELLASIGLQEFETAWPHELSGGMRQRVAIARAFAQKPSLLLLDEPFGALDAVTRRQLQVILLRLYEQSRCTVVFVTHDVEEALLLSDRILLLSERPGHIVKEIRVPFSRPRGDEIKWDMTMLAFRRDIIGWLENTSAERSNQSQNRTQSTVSQKS